MIYVIPSTHANFNIFHPGTHGKTHALLQHSTAYYIIRSVQDNVATPVTARMVTVCISTDGLSIVLISPDLSDTNSFHQCCWSIMPVTACSCRLQKFVPNIPVSGTEHLSAA